MSINVKNNVFWVGKIDWELRKFHGDEYSTHRGLTYNSYLIKEKKTAIFDTVWAPFAEEYVRNLTKEIELNNIDYVIEPQCGRCEEACPEDAIEAAKGI